MNCSVMQAESKVFDIDHAEVGGTLLHLWNFPNDIVNAVRNHHDPSENDVLNQIVQIADILESGDRTQPYDTKLNETIQEWQTKLFSFISNKPSST
jgi:HD-like signal output (HDOD) protein